MAEVRILQAARLKGRLSPEAAAICADVSVEEATAEIARLRDQGLLKGDPNVRATPEGKARVASLIEAERNDVDASALTAAYEEFDSHNNQLKAVITDWQLRDGDPNDHTDAGYDASVIARLVTLHEGFAPLVAKIAGLAPRLGPYSARFDHAIDQVRNGDHTYIARPIMDSYHTVWFEFHEELIGLLGLNREEEAAAGRAV